MSALRELQHEAYRVFLRNQFGIYKFNPNHDERGRFATGPHQGGRKASGAPEHGSGVLTEHERLAQAKAAMQKITDDLISPQYLDQEWEDGFLSRSDITVSWEEMQPCKQMRHEAAVLVGLAKDPKASTVDPFRHQAAEWGGEEPMGKVDAQRQALQLLHQLHSNGGELPVNGVLYRGSGVDPALIKQALKTGEQFDMPLASWGGAHPWLSTRYGGVNPEADGERKATVIFQLNSPKAALRAGGFIPPGEDWNQSDLYDHMDAWDAQEHDQGEFISGGRFKVKSLENKYVEGILEPGQTALVVELEHVGVFNPWTGEVE